MYLVTDVEGRSGIRIHPANWGGSVNHGYKRDLLGCIALGTSLIGGPGTGKQLMLTSSAVPTRRFEKLLNGEDFKLDIYGEFHERADQLTN